MDSAILLTSVISVFNLQQKFPGTLNVAIAFLVIYYLTMNICVNIFDLVWNFMLQGASYQHDDDFVSSFSYKTHQIVLIAMLSFISA
jgi:hypothetical protein